MLHTQQHYSKFDLNSWGPRSLKQQDSYSWTKDDRKQLTSLRDAKCLPPMVEYSQYSKLPPISAKGIEASHSDVPARLVSRKTHDRGHSRAYKARKVASTHEETDY